jgi:lysophospholipase L1-like esterase
MCAETESMGAHHRRRAVGSRRWLIGALLGVAIALTGTGTALAARLYVSVGDSVAAGMGASTGHSYFDLYCVYLQSAGRVDQCVNESEPGLTTQSALSDGVIAKAINDIAGSTDTPVVTVILGGNDLIGAGCEPITVAGCPFAQNMGTILLKLETALAAHPGPHYIQWLEYYNPNHDNPSGDPSLNTATATLLLGSDLALSDCSSPDASLFGLNDEINCTARHFGATAVDAYTPFQANCGPPTVCFSDSLHPNDTGYALIFDAFRDTPGTPVPTVPELGAVSESRTMFAPSTRHRRRGVTFFFRLNRPATVSGAIERLTAGRRLGSHCVRPSAGLRRRPLCTLVKPMITLTASGHTGRNTLHFSGDVRGRPLSPGRYRAVFTVAGALGASSHTLRFRILSA